MSAPSDLLGDLDALIEALDSADAELRGVYGQLVDDPDLAPSLDARIRELHERRTDLARRVGLTALAKRRADRSFSSVTTEPEHAEPTPIDAAPSPQEVDVHPNVAPTSPREPAPAEPEREEALEAPVSAPVVVPQPPASDAQLAAFKTAVESKRLGLGPTLTPAASPQRPWGISLHEVMCLLGPREPDLDNPIALDEELDALDEVATAERQSQWVRFPIEVQKHWLGHLVARTRAIREHPASEGVLGRLKTIRAVYPQWAREYVPGHINGLQLKHGPLRETDANDHWQGLVALVGHELPAEARRNPPTRKKKERPIVEEEPAVVEPDWPLLPIVRGKIAVIVGGAPKEPNRDRLEVYLRLATLDWPDIDGPRKVEAIAQRIARGAYDMVIVIQTLISHPEAERILEAARASRTRWAMVEGFGVAAIRGGLERFLNPARTG